jgi:hypothetical protein
MKTDQMCPEHPDRFLFDVCDELTCMECQEMEFKLNPFPVPKGPPVTMVFDGHKFNVVLATPEHPM